MADDLVDIRVSSECRDMIRARSFVTISSSAGKDSQTMTILQSHILPANRLVAVHPPFGEVEWRGTVGHVVHIEATLPATIKPSVAPPCR